jgi:hypothetical protein
MLSDSSIEAQVRTCIGAVKSLRWNFRSGEWRIAIARDPAPGAAVLEQPAMNIAAAHAASDDQ